MASKNKSGKGKGQSKASKTQSAPKNTDNAVEDVETRTQAPEPDNTAGEIRTLPSEENGGTVMAHAESLSAAENAAEVKAVAESAQEAKAEAEDSVKTAKEPPRAAASKAGKWPAPRMPEGIAKRPLFAGNPYMPMKATVGEIIQETHNIRTLRLVLKDAEAMRNFDFKPGQVGQISVFGAGEATFVINSPPSQKEYLQFSVMKAGEVTTAIHMLSEGDTVGLRAPLGNYFPYEDWKGKNVFFVGGGIGMAPIRVIMLHLLERKADYGKISLLYGSRTPKDMAYSYELDGWKNNPDLDCTLCIDNPYENWEHKVGLIPTVLEEINPSPENTVAVLCGPPVMIRFTLQSLQKLGFEPENIVTTLEKRMKCGIGICGRCNLGNRYVCLDGPVFTMKELQSLPNDL